MKSETHNLIVTEVIEHLNKRFAEHEFDHAECMIVLESIVASSLVSVSPEHEECCAITHLFFANVHERVHNIINTLPEKKDLH